MAGPDARCPVKPTAFVGHADCSLHDTGWKHPDHQGRLPALFRAVSRDMPALHGHLLEVEAIPATEAQLARVHTPEYIARVREAAERALRENQPVRVDDSVTVSGASWNAALAAVGAALSGVEVVASGDARNAFCAARPPGRGAHADRVGGFALFNNVAIAARELRARYGADRVLIVDWGTDPPDGTASVFHGDPAVRLLALHPPGSGGAAYREAFASALDGVLDGFRPDWILLSAGFDALRDDPLGTLSLEPPDFYPLTLLLRERADAVCDGRLVSVLEGGYAAEATGRAGVQHLRALCGLPPA